MGRALLGLLTLLLAAAQYLVPHGPRDPDACSGLTIDAPFPCTGILDRFDRGNGLLGALDPSATNWTHNFDTKPTEVTLSINGNRVVPTTAPDESGSETWNVFKSVNQEVYVTYPTVPLERANQLYARMQSVDRTVDADMYFCWFDSQPGAADDVVAIYRRKADGPPYFDNIVLVFPTPIPIPPHEYQDGDVFGMRVVDDLSGNPEIRCYLNGQVIAAATDTTSGKLTTPGYIGLYVADDATLAADNFGGGSLD